jgi:hypothetical protein
VVASRPGERAQKLAFPSVHITRLTRSVIATFCERYLGGQSSEFTALLQEHGLWELADTPYVLCALIVVFRQLGKARFPRTRAEIYGRLVRATIERERKRGYDGQIDIEKLEEQLVSFAITMAWRGNWGWESPPEDLEWELERVAGTQEVLVRFPDAAVASLAVRCGLLELDRDAVRFTHQITQEYFVALAITRYRNPIRGIGSDVALHLIAIVCEIDEASIVKFATAYSEILVSWLNSSCRSPTTRRNVARFMLAEPPPPLGGQWGPSLGLLLAQGCDAEILDYLSQPAVSAPLHAILCLRAIRGEDPELLARVRPYLGDRRTVDYGLVEFAANDYYADRGVYRSWVDEEAIACLLRSGDLAADMAVACRSRLMDDTLVQVTNTWDGSGQRSETWERSGNRVAHLILRYVTRNHPLHAELVAWLHTQLASDAVAKDNHWSYGAGDDRSVSKQSDWAREVLDSLQR